MKCKNPSIGIFYLQPNKFNLYFKRIKLKIKLLIETFYEININYLWLWFIYKYFLWTRKK